MQIVFQCNYILSFQFYFQEEVWICLFVCLFQSWLSKQAGFEKKQSLNVKLHVSWAAFKLSIVSTLKKKN